MPDLKYENCSDEELIRRYRNGESEIMDFLLEKYKNLVRKRANALFLLGGETEDLIQEGMIGLFKAVQGYDETRGSFYSFALLCVNRQLYHAIELASRKKHTPLNSYISLSPDGANEEQIAVDRSVIDQRTWDPETLFLDQETADGLLQKLLQALSPLEKEVLHAYMDGRNYRQIAEIMGKSPKVIDNALHRIRVKMQKIIKDVQHE